MPGRTKRRPPLPGSRRTKITDRGERAREALARAKQITGICNSETPLGYRRVYAQRIRRDVTLPDHHALVLMRYIRALRNREGLSFKKIAERLEAVLAKRENRLPTRYPWSLRYDRDAVRRRYIRCVEMYGSGRPGDEGPCRGKRIWRRTDNPKQSA